MTTCSYCGGPLTLIAAIEDPAVIVKILAHLGLPTKAPPRAPVQVAHLFPPLFIAPRSENAFSGKAESNIYAELCGSVFSDSHLDMFRT